MKFFQMDSPLMNFLNKAADLMWLNILALICCIPIVTAGASFTALHYVALKIVRNEESYITRGFLKSFKQNFKQATAIWLILLLAMLLLAGDFYIIFYSGMEFNVVIKVIIMAAIVLVAFVATFVFPLLAKFDNTVKQTIKNAFFMSIMQLPKTILMIVMNLAPIVLAMFSYKAFPIVFMFGLAVPASSSAMLYDKVFQKLEDKILEASGEQTTGEEDEHIFSDKVEGDATDVNSRI